MRFGCTEDEGAGAGVCGGGVTYTVDGVKGMQSSAKVLGDSLSTLQGRLRDAARRSVGLSRGRVCAPRRPHFPDGVEPSLGTPCLDGSDKLT